MKFSDWLVSAVLMAGVGGGALQAGNPVAILDSAKNTKAFFEEHYSTCNLQGGPYYLPGGDEYQRYFRGWMYVLDNVDPRIPYDRIYDDDVTEERLSDYKVLILSNTASLSDKQEKAIQQWVIRGGRLLATFGSGYKDIILDPRQDDGLKLQKGGTFGLHELWHDPMSKVFGSNPVNSGAGTDVRITQYVGPTSTLTNKLTDNLLLYGAESNLLVQRPENFQGALGFVVLKEYSGRYHPTPAILLTRAAQGLVVYFAFAPEYLVSKEFGLPTSPSCDDGQSWAGRSKQGRILMESTVRYLLNN